LFFAIDRSVRPNCRMAAQEGRPQVMNSLVRFSTPQGDIPIVFGDLWSMGQKMILLLAVDR